MQLLMVSLNPLATLGVSSSDRSKWKRKSIVTLALTILTSSQAILIVWSKRAGKYEYSVTTANFMVETLKCALSLAALARIWRTEGVTEDNRLSTTLNEVIVYPIPAFLYLIKNLLQYYIFAYVNAPGYQILKNLNIISTGVLYRIILKRELSEIQWAAFVLLCAGCTTAQLNSNSDRVLETPVQGWIMAIVMALLSGFAGVYAEAIMKRRPSRNINVQNFWLYIFGMIFNAIAIVIQDFDAVANKGFFHGYSLITTLMILNHALSGIAVSMVMKYADNIVKRGICLGVLALHWEAAKIVMSTQSTKQHRALWLLLQFFLILNHDFFIDYIELLGKRIRLTRAKISSCNSYACRVKSKKMSYFFKCCFLGKYIYI
ncbi:hypothetical protein BT93_I1186 [Corymbia citriodora subsp. variegata]|nr:hypothetical protein BT93_I1186 [Corymbia citriodora subsp. variegata]